MSLSRQPIGERATREDLSGVGVVHEQVDSSKGFGDPLQQLRLSEPPPPEDPDERGCWTPKLGAEGQQLMDPVDEFHGNMDYRIR